MYYCHPPAIGSLSFNTKGFARLKGTAHGTRPVLWPGGGDNKAGTVDEEIDVAGIVDFHANIDRVSRPVIVYPWDVPLILCTRIAEITGKKNKAVVFLIKSGTSGKEYERGEW